MKKIIAIILLSVSLNAEAQQATAPAKISQPISQKSKIGKGVMAFSGAAFVAGSIIGYKALNMKDEPIPVANGQTTTYHPSKYNESQRKAKQNSFLLYGVGGLALAIGAIIAF
jgi:hypothetical protein